MYKFEREKQLTLEDFDQPLGMKMNPENRWVIKASIIPWETIEAEYSQLFPSKTGMPAKPLRMALGSLLIQRQYGFSDEELVEQIRENPYYQYFVGLSRYEDIIPFVPSLLVEFRKRLPEDKLVEINEMIIEYYNHLVEESKSDDDSDNDSHGGGSKEEKSQEPCGEETSKNKGTMMLDATCAPQNIEYPQDVNLLNEVREKLEKNIDKVCEATGSRKPRTYRKNARKAYLALAKCKKRPAKKIRKAIKQQLSYIKRDLKHLDKLVESTGYEFSQKEKDELEVLKKVYEQQKYMYDNKIHSVENRIVSISQPYIRPIVRGKAKAPTEFGAKLDLSVDDQGMARVEKLSFDAYNESDVLIKAAEAYRERTGYYPERILADQIYRNRTNMKFCQENGIRLSGKKLGRPKKDDIIDKKTEYKDNTDRIEVERKFSLAKRKFGLGLLMTKREDTTKSSILLSIIAMNLDRLAMIFLYCFFWLLSFAMNLFDRTQICSSKIRFLKTSTY